MNILKNNKKQIVIVTLSVAIAFVPQYSWSIDLLDAWQKAKNYSSEFSAAKHASQAMKEKSQLIKASLLPQISAGASLNRQQVKQSYDTSYATSKDIGIQLNQVIVDPERFAAYKQDQTRITVADVKLYEAEEKLLIKVSQAYFDILLTAEQLKTIRLAKQAYSKQMEQAQALFDIGSATDVDIYEAQAGYESFIAQEIMLQAKQTVANNLLNSLIGSYGDNIEAVDTKSALTLTINQDLAFWQQQALANNSKRKELELLLQVAKQEVHVRAAAHLPKVMFSATQMSSLQQRDFLGSPLNSRTKNGSVSLSLNVPLYSGGGINRRVLEAKEQEYEALDNLLEYDRQLQHIMQKYYLNVMSTKARIVAQDRLLRTQIAKVDATKVSKDVGLRSNLDLLQALQSQADAQTQLAEVQYVYLQSYLLLLQEAGMLRDGNKLLEINKLLFNKKNEKVANKK